MMDSACDNGHEQRLDCALDLLHRLPPQHMEKNLHLLSLVRPSLTEDLLSAADRPLKLAWDRSVGQYFLTADFNRDGDSYRSPWTNTYFPPLVDGLVPSITLRRLEVSANEAFKVYMDMYYESGGISSVYFWDLNGGEPGDFAGAVLLKKQGPSAAATQHREDNADAFTEDMLEDLPTKGAWDSTHVIEVKQIEPRRFVYRLTSTIILSLLTRRPALGMVNLGGMLTRQVSREDAITSSNPAVLDKAHLVNIGELVEENENRMKATLQEVYFWRTKDVITRCLRSLRPLQLEREKRRRWSEISLAAAIRRTPSGKHLMVPHLDELRV